MHALLKITLIACFAAVAAAQSSTGGAGPAPRTPDQSICDYYASAQGVTQKQFVQWILDGALSGKTKGNELVPGVSGIIKHTSTKVFFDGTKQYRLASNSATWNKPAAAANLDKTPNFIADEPEGVQSWLVNHLLAFFGSEGALDCTDSTFPQYTETYGQTAVHTNMNITQGVFNVFNNQVVGTAKFLGVSADDLDIVAGVLNSFGRVGTGSTASPYGPNVICQEMDCECATGYKSQNIDPTCSTPVVNAAASSSFSLLALAAAALVALFAMRA